MLIRKITLIASLLFLASTGHTSPQPTPFWISAGLGVGVSGRGSRIGAAKGFSLSFKPSWLLFTLKYEHMDKNAFTFLGDVHPHETVSDFGFMIGTATVKPNGETASIAVGISSVSRVWQGEKIPDDRWFHLTYEKLTASATGLGFRFEGYGTGWLGISVFANLNSIESYGGFMLCGRIGGYK